MRHVTIVLAAGLAISLAGCAVERKVLYRVNAGATKEYADSTGAKWAADKEYVAGGKYGAAGGKPLTRTTLKEVQGTKEQGIYLTERYDMTAYTFEVPNGKYAVRLHFAETYEGITAAGQRVFSVKIQGQVVLKDLDVMKEAGGFGKALVKEMRGVEVKDGKLTVEFVKQVQNPEVNGIEILAE